MDITRNISQKVKKLLVLAADQQGTPEGKRALDKAAELTSKYGMEQDTPVDPSEFPEVTHEMVFAFDDKPYQHMQLIMLDQIAIGLNCDPHRRFRSVEVYGSREDIEKVKFLFPLAVDAMIEGAKNTVAPGTFRIRKARADYMAGFSVSVGGSLMIQSTREHQEKGRDAQWLRDYHTYVGDSAEKKILKEYPGAVITEGEGYRVENTFAWDSGTRDGMKFDTKFREPISA